MLLATLTLVSTATVPLHGLDITVCNPASLTNGGKYIMPLSTQASLGDTTLNTSTTQCDPPVYSNKGPRPLKRREYSDIVKIHSSSPGQMG